MEQKYHIRGFLVGFVAALMLVALASPALAAVMQSIEVSADVKVYVDDIPIDAGDLNGNPEAFIYNGTTYLPARAVSNSLGKEVQWDGTSRSVYIGKHGDSKSLLMNVCPPYQSHRYHTVETFQVAGNKYTNGIIIPDVRYNDDGWALFNLNGQYNTLEFDIGHGDGWGMNRATLTIRLDGELAYTLDLDPYALPQHCVVPLNGALQMKIEMTQPGHCYCLYNATIS